MTVKNLLWSVVQEHQGQGIPVLGGKGNFQNLTILKSGYMKGASGEFAGDVAESWELSPDRLQMTFKLRPNAGFAPVPPA